MRKGRSENGFATLAAVLCVVSVSSAIILSVHDTRFVPCHLSVSAVIAFLVMGAMR